MRQLYVAARKHRAVTGSWPRVIAPVTHTDHLFWYKTCFRDPLLPQRQDKIAVKDFVTRTLGPEWVIPTLWDGARLPRRDRRTWPRPFVVKANHGCGFNTFVRGRARWSEVESRARDWMGTTFGGGERAEWGYSQIEPRLFVEPMIGTPGTFPLEYKCWVFDGRVHYFQASERVGRRHWTRYFDRDFVQQPFQSKFNPPPGPGRPLPACMPEVIDAAERISRGFPYVRADFYVVDGRPLFSEMTFYPAGGFGPLKPHAWETKVGDLWPSPPRTLRSLPLRVWTVLRPGSAPWTRCSEVPADPEPASGGARGRQTAGAVPE